MDSDTGWLDRINPAFVVRNSAFDASHVATDMAGSSWQQIMRIDQVHFLAELFRTPAFGLSLTVASYLAGRTLKGPAEATA